MDIEQRPELVFREEEGHLLSVVLWPAHQEPSPCPTARPGPPLAAPGFSQLPAAEALPLGSLQFHSKKKDLWLALRSCV